METKKAKYNWYSYIHDKEYEIMVFDIDFLLYKSATFYI